MNLQAIHSGREDKVRFGISETVISHDIFNDHWRDSLIDAQRLRIYDHWPLFRAEPEPAVMGLESARLPFVETCVTLHPVEGRVHPAVQTVGFARIKILHLLPRKMSDPPWRTYPEVAIVIDDESINFVGKESVLHTVRREFPISQAGQAGMR